MSLNDFERTADTLYVLPGATLDIAPGKNHPPKKVVINRLALTRLPKAMRNMGWETAAALMQRWFDSPAWAMPAEWKQEETQPNALNLNSANCDDQIVKMAWAMGFANCREAVEVARSRIATPKAVELLKKRLREAGWVTGTSFNLGFYGMSARQMDAMSQVNISGFGETLDTLDDMYGALGRAIVKVGVIGAAYFELNPLTEKTHDYFRISHVGYYLRDNYDFNGFQYLGTWTEDRVLTKAETVASLTPAGQSIISIGSEVFAAVTNADFRNYRAQHGVGGDFVLYSDIFWEKHDRVIDLGEIP